MLSSGSPVLVRERTTNTSGRSEAVRRRRRKKAVRRAWNAAWITAACIFSVVPLVAVLSASVSPTTYWSAPPPGFTTEWYQRVWNTPDIKSSLVTSLTVALIVSAITVVVAIGAALALTRGRRGVNNKLANLTLLPLLFPHVALGLALYSFLLRLRLPITTLSLVFAELVITLPLVIRVLMVRMQSPELRDIERASLDLGVTPTVTLLRVTLPQIKSILFAAALISFTTCFDDSAIALFVNSPSTITFPVRLLFYRDSQSASFVAAGGSILLLAGIVIVLIVSRTIGLRRALGYDNTQSR